MTERPDFYCWDCDRRFTLPGDGFPPHSGIIQCKHCGSMQVYWLHAKTKEGVKS